MNKERARKTVDGLRVSGLVFCLVILLPVVLSANKIAISNVVLNNPITADKYVMVQFDLSWDNSWRTSSGPTNWDAAWVFVKYRVGSGDWQHAYLNDTGHSGGTGGTGVTVKAGLPDEGSAFHLTTNPAVGVFIYRSGDGSGTLSVTGAKLRWNYGANSVADEAIMDIRVFAVEMVYVPEGAFYVGDGTTNNVKGQFRNGNANTPFQITSSNDITAITLGGTAAGSLANNNASGMATPDDFNNSTTQSLPAAFPKGYKAFYCMKYEISQQQYVDFLNSLTQTQATARKYDKPTSNYRYEITGSSVGSYTTTNPYVACNYLSWADGAAYSDWAGLRPMTELEYEKACRGTVSAVANEYAWGTATIAAVAYTLSIAGAANEGIATNYSTAANTGNAIYATTGSSIAGPVRVGIFAAHSSNNGRLTAGASYYGIMEMSGNFCERPVTIGNTKGREFTGLHGNGALGVSGADVSNWPGTDAIGTGFRGGSWLDGPLNLRVSERSYAAFTNNGPYSDRGFRAVRSGPAP